MLFPGATLWIESLAPATYHPGQTLQVTVKGRGFNSAVRVHFLDPDPSAPDGTVNPDLQILAVHYVDPETLLLDIAVAQGARLITNAPIAYGRSK